MPLNIAPVEGVENPELEEFKRTVVIAARAMAKKHSLCSVVDNTLESIGLDPKLPQKTTQKVEVQLNIPVKAVVDIDTFGLAGLTPEEQNAKVASMLTATLRLKGQAGGETRVEVKELNVLDLNEPTAQIVGDRVVPDGYVGRFTGPDGRVMHFVHEDNVGGNHRYYQNLSVCGEVYAVAESSPRDEGRTCVKCAQRVEL